MSSGYSVLKDMSLDSLTQPTMALPLAQATTSSSIEHYKSVPVTHSLRSLSSVYLARLISSKWKFCYSPARTCDLEVSCLTRAYVAGILKLLASPSHSLHRVNPLLTGETGGKHQACCAFRRKTLSHCQTAGNVGNLNTICYPPAK